MAICLFGAEPLSKFMNNGLLSIGHLGTNFSEIQKFLFTKIHQKILSARWWPFCPEGNELMVNT